MTALVLPRRELILPRPALLRYPLGDWQRWSKKLRKLFMDGQFFPGQTIQFEGDGFLAPAGGLSFIAAAKTAIGFATNKVFTVPTHQTGDLLLLWNRHSSNTLNSVSTSGGGTWAQIANTVLSVTNSFMRSGVWWCRATSASETATANMSANTNCGGVVACIRGAVASGTPVFGGAAQDEGLLGAGTHSYTMPSITTTAANSWHMSFAPSSSGTDDITDFVDWTGGATSDGQLLWEEDIDYTLNIVKATIAAIGASGTSTLQISHTGNTQDVICSFGITPA